MYHRQQLNVAVRIKIIALLHLSVCLTTFEISPVNGELGKANASKVIQYDTHRYHSSLHHQHQSIEKLSRATNALKFEYIHQIKPSIGYQQQDGMQKSSLLAIGATESSLYPRPTETRNVVSLNGVYEFCLDQQQVGLQKDWFSKPLSNSCLGQDLFRMPVPSSYNDITPLKKVRDHVGWVWYQTTIPCPSVGSWRYSNQVVHLLRFDSVNYEAIVWLNDKKLGSHIGGHLPFAFQLTQVDMCGSRLNDQLNNQSSSLLDPINNRLTIAVNNNLTLHTIPSGQLRQIKLANGRTIERFRPDFDFFNYAGILRDVRLYTVPEMYISDIGTSVSFSEDSAQSPESNTGSDWWYPKQASVNYKIKVAVSSRLMSWMNILSGAEREKVPNLSLSVVMSTASNILVNKTETIVKITHLPVVIVQGDPAVGHNNYNDGTRGYLELEGQMTVDRPKLWHPYPGLKMSGRQPNSGSAGSQRGHEESIDHEESESEKLSYRAHLYNMAFEIKFNNHRALSIASGVISSQLEPSQPIRDVYDLSIGLKTVEIIAENGPFLINKRPIYLRGFGKHEEQSIRGRSLDLATLMRDVYLIKWTGANVIRTSHYPYSEEFLDEMDAHGIMVIDECPAVGLNYFDENKLRLHQNMMSELIQRDKNRASVIMWSLANEPRSSLKECDRYFKSLTEFTKRMQLPLKLPMTGAIAEDFNPTNDYFGQYLDVLMINRYYGWYEDTGYTDQIYDKLTNDLENWIKKFQRPLMMSEYGADTVQGLHSLPDSVFSEEFQLNLLSEYHRAFDYLRLNDTKTRDFFIGEMLWNFADFQTHQGLTRVGGNRKGVFTRDRQPKASAHMIRSRYWSL